MKSPAPLPLRLQNFNFLRKRGRVYVDKTALVAKIARIEATPIFLSRPRRFGKSLLLSTFHSLFSCGTKYFAGLDIEKKWSDSTYHIVEIDFSTFSETGNGTLNFSERFCNILKTFFEPILGIIPEIKSDPQLLLERMLLKCEDFSIVLLIDEYDAPLTKTMDNIDVFHQRRSIINEFYSIVKKYSHKFRFIFITGVTRYSDINMFSGFNNILDISMEPEYGTLVGYTDEELDRYFSCHIENAANVFGTSVEDIRNGLRINYDGYCFDRECRTRVYNTWSILNFLDAPSKISGYQRYWFNSGGISTIIVSYLKSLAKIPASSKYGLSILEEKLRMPISVDINELTLRSDHPSKILPEALLFQTGYLSINGADGNRVSLAIPNEEVRCSLRDLFYLDIMSEDSSIKDFIDEYQRTNIIKILYSGNEHDLKKWIAAAFNTFSYESKVLLTNESLLRDFIYSIVSNKQIFCSREEPSGKGRADLIIEPEHGHRIVIEFKLARKNGPRPEKLLEDARRQIVDRDYGNTAPLSLLLRYAVVMVPPMDGKDADILVSRVS